MPSFLYCQLIISAPSLPASADAINSHRLSRSLLTAQTHLHSSSGEDHLLSCICECSWRGRHELDSSTFHPLTSIPSMFCLIELKSAVREYGCSHASLFMNPREIMEWGGRKSSSICPRHHQWAVRVPGPAEANRIPARHKGLRAVTKQLDLPRSPAITLQQLPSFQIRKAALPSCVSLTDS